MIWPNEIGKREGANIKVEIERWICVSEVKGYSVKMEKGHERFSHSAAIQNGVLSESNVITRPSTLSFSLNLPPSLSFSLSFSLSLFPPPSYPVLRKHPSSPALSALLMCFRQRLRRADRVFAHFREGLHLASYAVAKELKEMSGKSEGGVLCLCLCVCVCERERESKY